MVFLSTLLIALLTTIILIPALGGAAARFHVLDIPDERKVHDRPIPRTGGIAMAAGAIIPLLLWAHGDGFVQAYLAGVAIVIVFGIVDDCKDISPKWKFIGQFAASLVVIFYGGVTIRTLGMLVPMSPDLPGWISVPLTVLAIMGVTNAINLADGLDGLYAAAGEVEASAAQVKKMIELDPKEYSYRITPAGLYWNTGQQEKAREYTRLHTIRGLREDCSVAVGAISDQTWFRCGSCTFCLASRVLGHAWTCLTSTARFDYEPWRGYPDQSGDKLRAASQATLGLADPSSLDQV